MRIWLVTVGEPLPSDGTGERLLRTGLVASELAARLHDVTFWTSTFDHTAKKQRANHSRSIQIASNYRVELLHADGYRRNISLARIRHHQRIARAFQHAAESADRPDVILCSMPLWELCDVATQYGLAHDIPTLIDIRDMWPDAIIDLVPQPFRPFARSLAKPAYESFQRSIQAATAVTGMTDAAVEWALQAANKCRSPKDVAFPFGYRQRAAKPQDVLEAEKFWDSLGVTADDEYFNICFFGAIGSHFDIETVLAAEQQLTSAGCNVRFILCGTGDSLPKWRKKAAGRTNFLLPGWVNAAKIHSLMKRCSAGLAPYYSSWDFELSIPNKPIEYFSAALPVLSSLRGELAHLLASRRCGFTYNEGDAGSLVAAIQRLRHSPELRGAMSRRAKALYTERFVAEKVYSHMSDFLEQLVKQNRPQETEFLKSDRLMRAA